MDASIYEGQDLEALSDLPHYNGWILEEFRPYLRGKVIEVGAGIGNFAAHYASWVNELVLVEPAHTLYPRLSGRFAHLPHVQTMCSLVEESFFTLDGRGTGREGTFDAVVLVNVLEHVPADSELLAHLLRMLRPGGHLLLFVPALPWLYGSLDRLVHHQRRYTRGGLSALISASGFTIHSLHYFDLPGTLPWFVAGRILRHRTFSRRAAQLYDRWAVPAIQLIERRFTPAFGKNLICVAQRPQKTTRAG